MNEQEKLLHQVKESLAWGEALHQKNRQQRKNFSELINEHADPILKEIWEKEFSRWQTEQGLLTKKTNIGRNV